MSYYGDIALGSTIDVKFTTQTAAGVPTTLAGTPAVAAYVGNSNTEITAGITLLVDFDSLTGLNNVRVVATTGNGFATATNVALVLTAGTVDSVSVVGVVVGSFSIEGRSALRPATAGRTIGVDSGGKASATLAATDVTGNIAADLQTVKTQTVTCAAGIAVGAFVGNATAALAVDASGRIDLGKILGTASAGAVGHVGIDWGHVTAPTTTLNLSGTTISVGQAVASVTSDVTLDLTQAIPNSNTAETVGDALNAARAQGFGPWRLVGTTLTIYAEDGTTAVKTFTIDSAIAPTRRY